MPSERRPPLVSLATTLASPQNVLLPSHIDPSCRAGNHHLAWSNAAQIPTTNPVGSTEGLSATWGPPIVHAASPDRGGAVSWGYVRGLGSARGWMGMKLIKRLAIA